MATKNEKVEAIQGLAKTCSEYAEISQKMYDQLVNFVKMFGGERKRINMFPCVGNHNTQNKFLCEMPSNDEFYGQSICAVEVNEDNQLWLYLMDRDDTHAMVGECKDLTDDDLDEMDEIICWELERNDLDGLPIIKSIFNFVGDYVQWQI